MADTELFFSLLRISTAQALRAAGITSAKLSAVDTFTDIHRRYLLLLGTTARDIASAAGRIEVELDDVRLALEHVGLIRPINIFNDEYDEDTRGVDALIEWFRGVQAGEMRRVVGAGESEEWRGALKKIAEKKARE